MQIYSAFPGPSRALALLVAAALCVTLSFPAGAEDGRPLLNQVLRAYHDLKSYSGVTTVEAAYVYQKRPISVNSEQANLEFKRPNEMSLVFTATKGTRRVVVNGKTVSFYNSSMNQYDVKKCPPTMAGVKRLLAGAGIAESYDPLYFLTTDKLPDALVSVKLGGKRNDNGKEVQVVIGLLRMPARTVNYAPGKTARLNADAARVEWWIDPHTMLLTKVLAGNSNVPLPAMVRTGKHKPALQYVNVTRALRITISHVAASPNLPDTDFAFSPPSDATVRHDDHELMTGVLRKIEVPEQ